ncbi:MAG: hypothetical protein ACKO4Z_12145, partial [Planctomycetota bacterium]
MGAQAASAGSHLGLEQAKVDPPEGPRSARTAIAIPLKLLAGRFPLQGCVQITSGCGCIQLLLDCLLDSLRSSLYLLVVLSPCRIEIGVLNASLKWKTAGGRETRAPSRLD